MTPERWRQVKEILAGALERPEVERAAFVAASCEGDAALETEVRSLLAAPDSFMQRPLVEELPSDAWDAEDETLDPGTRLGPYEIVRLLGRGGMGAVYLAARADGEFRHRVAIKTIPRGMDTADVLRRFRAERQILAGLTHPNIARLLDGGTTADGRPYLVMEYVDGVPVDHYCAERQLSIADRLRLCTRICHAVHYAHQRLVVHRDLKPSNVLVSADGTPKLLDFGIAKLLIADSGDDAPLTRTGGALRPMTPEYAAPEQIRGEPVTTATDVYALGVLLYELLTGRRPHADRRSSTHTLLEAICHEEPPRPSAVVTAHDDRKRLRGDVDTIVLTALHKDVWRRYASAEQLAGDVQRHLDGLPVSARADALGYRALKFVRRHRAAVAAAAAVLMSVVGGAGMAVWQARTAERERLRAERRFNEVRGLANSMLFELHDAIDQGPVKTRQLLAGHARRYLESLAGDTAADPALTSELAAAYARLGDIYGGGGHFGNLGDRPSAIDMYRKAIALREQVASSAQAAADNRRELASNYLALGRAANADGNPAAALPHLQRAAALLDAMSAANPADDKARQYQAVAHVELGTILGAGAAGVAGLGRRADALSHLQRAVAIAESRVGQGGSADTRQALSAMYAELANWYSAEGRHAESLPLTEKAILLLERLVAESPHHVFYRRNLAAAYINAAISRRTQNDVGGALGLAERSLPHFQAIVDADPADAHAKQDLGIGYRNLAVMLDASGRPAEALPHFATAAALLSSGLALDPGNGFLQRQLAQTYLTTATTELGVRGPAASLATIAKGIALADALVQREPENVTAARTLALSYAHAGKSSCAAAQPEAGRRFYDRSLEVWAAMQKTAGPLAPPDASRAAAAAKERGSCLVGG